VVDVSGTFVLPGLIDAHVHPIHGETFASVSEAAAFGGVTTVLHHVYPEPKRSLWDWLVAAHSEASMQSSVDFGFHARLRADSPEHLDELGRVAAFGVRSFKVFLSYSAPGVAVRAGDLPSLLEAVRTVRGLLLVHAEDQTAIEASDGVVDSTAYAPDDYLRARAPSVEANAVAAAAATAREIGVPIYFVHVSGADAMSAIDASRRRGAKVFAETCPHYLLLEAEDALRRFGARAKIAPPLRTNNDRRTLWTALADGRIDTIASDHCGYDRAEKEPTAVSFRAAGFGAPGIETMLPLMFDAALDGAISLERLVDLLAESPARIFGLAQKGRLEVGRDADLVIVDPGTTRIIAGAGQHGAAYYSLYEGRKVQGSIQGVYLRGEAIISEGNACGTGPAGTFLRVRPVV
jgi:dihydropyrimidinase